MRQAYSVFIPTITASGVPHSAFAPVRLLRQTMTAFIAGGDGAGAVTTGAAEGCGAGVAGREHPIKMSASTAARVGVFMSSPPDEWLARPRVPDA
jgi:hypothetical protein